MARAAAPVKTSRSARTETSPFPPFRRCTSAAKNSPNSTIPSDRPPPTLRARVKLPTSGPFIAIERQLFLCEQLLTDSFYAPQFGSLWLPVTGRRPDGLPWKTTTLCPSSGCSRGSNRFNVRFRDNNVIIRRLRVTAVISARVRLRLEFCQLAWTGILVMFHSNEYSITRHYDSKIGVCKSYSYVYIYIFKKFILLWE